LRFLSPCQEEKAPPAGEQQQGDESVPSTDDLVRQLGDPSYQERRGAEQALRQRGESALPALRAAAKDDSEPEIQWRARRLIRQIEGGGQPDRLTPPDRRGAAPRFSMPDRGHDLESMFDTLFQQMERDFGMDIPRRRFFSDDFFRDLQQQMQDAGTGHAQGFSMKVDPDGVRVEVTETTPDGKQDKKVYEAPDMETFREKYPEIAQRYMNARPWTLRFGPRTGGPLAPRAWQVVPPTQQHEELDGNRLGVYVDPVSEAVAEFLGLEAGQGLRVREVTPDSLGSALAIEPGDIVLRVAGKDISSTEDVRAALQGVETGQKVEVVVNRRGAEKTLSADKPAAPESTKKAEKLQKRGQTQDR
jgi:hypothetical protein